MGSGIAQACGLSGYQVTIFDANAAALDKALGIINKNLQKGIDRGKISESQKEDCLNSLAFVENLADVQADIIIEAVIEKLDVKQEIFRQLEDHNSADTILATNTSSIPISQIADGLQRPEKVVGLHFFNPAHIMKLVEVISGVETSDETRLQTRTFAESLGKVVVEAKDSPGFIVNRVARHFYVEGLKVLEDEVATAEQIDNLIEASGFKLGPYRLMDLIGVDVNLSVTQSLYDSFDQAHKFKPNQIQIDKVNEGKLGRKSGEGFYKYE